jgi:short-subunit dehydrogenase
MEIRGKKVLITGAAGGIGKALSIEVARKGGDLFLCDIDEQGLRETKKIIDTIGQQCMTMVVDVSNSEQVKEMVAKVLDAYGHIDVLINNAGVTLLGEVRDYNLEDWARIMGINLWGPIYAVYYILPHMVERRAGHIVNVASAGGLISLPGNGAYCTTKFGIVGFSEVLRSELKRCGVGVTLVCPGGVDTAFEKHGSVKGWTRFSPGTFVKGTKRKPEDVAGKIVRAIQKNKFLAIIGPEARLFYLVKRFFPRFYYYIGLRLARDLEKWR